MQTPTVTEISRETYFAVRRGWPGTPVRPQSAPAG